MKRSVCIFLSVLMFSMFFVSCGGDDDPNVVGGDNNNETTDEATDGEVTDEVADETTDEVQDTVDEMEVPDEVEDNNTETPDDSQFQKVGEFNLMFNGKVNTDLSDYMSIKGGEGDVNFTHNGMNITFTKQTVIIVQLFPLAILQGSNVAVMWLDSAPGLGAETKQVFGFTFPSTATPGDQTMEAAQAYAFYGDIDINVQGGQFNVKCVRSAAIMGSFNVISYDGANANFSAMGDLLDPAAAGSQLPYPVCTD